MAYFGDLWSSLPSRPDSDGGFSPDWKYFAFLVHHGILPSGVIESTIYVFKSGEIASFLNGRTSRPIPFPIVSMRGAVNGGSWEADRGNIITQLTWSDDSKELAFRASPDGETRHLFTVDIDSRQVRQLTPKDQDVQDYDRNGDTFVYLAGPALQASQTWVSAGPSLPDVEDATGKALVNLLYPNWRQNVLRRLPTELWVVRDAKSAPVLGAKSGLPVRFVPRRGAGHSLAISPDTKHVVITAVADDIPASWEQYRTRGGAAFRISADHERSPRIDDVGMYVDWFRAEEYVAVDLDDGNKRRLFNAPTADGWPGDSKAVWSSDSSKIIATATFLSPDKASVRDYRVPCNLAIANVATGSSSCVEEYSKSTGSESASIYDVHRAAVGSDHIEVLYKSVPYGSAGTISFTKLLRLSSEEFEEDVRLVRRDIDQFSVSVKQGLNTPPVLIATDEATGKHKELFDPNPQLHEIALAHGSVFSWKDHNGRIVTGGLLKPPDYEPGRRYPLVIQTHGFNPAAFMRSGFDETGFAAQALAGRDMVVLQVAEPSSLGKFSPSRAEVDGTDVYLAAIDELASQGVIDPDHVGVSGWSVTGMYTITSLVKAPRRFSAAVVANGDTATLWHYLASMDMFDPKVMSDFYEQYADAKPYAAGLEKWIAQTPGFNTDKIEAPLLLAACDPYHLVIGTWPMYAMLRDQGKPVDLLYMRSGQHSLTKPRQRLILQEMIVDWYQFWLSGLEDPSPTKAGQYSRWRALRANSKPPLLAK